MKPVSYPEANRIVYRIRTALTGESTGLETAKLAWQFAEAVERANQDLAAATTALENGSLLDCLLIEQEHPRLLETVKTLDFPLAEKWTQRCQTYSWRQAPALDRDAATRIQNAIAEQDKLSDWLYKQYRAAVRSKNPVAAYRIIHLIAQRFPEDTSAPAEAKRHTTELLAHAAADVKNVLEQLIPTETVADVIRRYLDLGLPLADSKDSLLLEQLAAEDAQRQLRIANQVESVFKRAEALAEDAEWQELEMDYLACDYRIATRDARGSIEPAIRKEFEAIETQLSRRRRSFESIISIRVAIQQLKAKQDDPQLLPLNGSGKPPSFKHRLEKLRSLEKQMLKTAGQIPADLQQELKEAYAYARKKRIPALAVIATASAAAVFAVSIFLYNQKQEALAEQEKAAALAALHAAERSATVSSAQQALDTHQALIAAAPADSPLAEQAELLGAWIASQTKLEHTYTEKLSHLEALLDAPDPTENQVAIEGLITTIQSTRRDLSADLGQLLDARLADLQQQWQASLNAVVQERARTLRRHERELRIALDNANKAKSKTEYDRLANAAFERIQLLKQSLEEDETPNTQLTTFLELATNQLNETGTKWAALDSQWENLYAANDLPTYLDALERIHSFDTLPTKDKADIAQSLRLKPQLDSLKNNLLLPTSNEVAQVFANEADFLSSPIEPTEDEIATLKTLAGLKSFSDVYTSQVQYFEGSASPQSEYTTLLVEPVAKSDAIENATHIAFTFTVHGFDESGAAEPNARDISFISRSDGSFWGFFYKPSSLSPESEYFDHSLKNHLTLAQSGADRLALVKAFAELETQTELAPAFRAYWQEQLLSIIQGDPWKWGIALSPSLKKHAAALANKTDGSITAELWRSTIEQTVPSPLFADLLAEAHGATALKEIEAIAGLYQNLLQGNFSLVGTIARDGKPNLRSAVSKNERLWTLNALTGQFETIRPDLELTPFAPILRYQTKSGNTLDSLLTTATRASGLNLTQPPYQSYLPPLLTQ